MRSSPQRASAFVRGQSWITISADRHNTHSLYPRRSDDRQAQWDQKRGAPLPQELRDVTIVSKAAFCGLILLCAGGTSPAAESVVPPLGGDEYLARAADCLSCQSIPAAKAVAAGLKMG